MKQENRTPLNKSRDLTGQGKIYFRIKYWLGVVVVGLVVGLSIQFVVAWSEPTNNPPEGGGESEGWNRVCRYTECQPVCGKTNDVQCPSGWDRAALLMAGDGCDKEAVGRVVKISPDGCFRYIQSTKPWAHMGANEVLEIEGVSQASVNCVLYGSGMPPKPTHLKSSCAVCCRE